MPPKMNAANERGFKHMSKQNTDDPGDATANCGSKDENAPVHPVA